MRETIHFRIYFRICFPFFPQFSNAESAFFSRFIQYQYGGILVGSRWLKASMSHWEKAHTNSFPSNWYKYVVPLNSTLNSSPFKGALSFYFDYFSTSISSILTSIFFVAKLKFISYELSYNFRKVFRNT